MSECIHRSARHEPPRATGPAPTHSLGVSGRSPRRVVTLSFRLASACFPRTRALAVLLYSLALALSRTRRSPPLNRPYTHIHAADPSVSRPGALDVPIYLEKPLLGASIHPVEARVAALGTIFRSNFLLLSAKFTFDWRIFAPEAAKPAFGVTQKFAKKTVLRNFFRSSPPPWTLARARCHRFVAVKEKGHGGRFMWPSPARHTNAKSCSPPRLM